MTMTAIQQDVRFFHIMDINQNNTLFRYSNCFKPLLFATLCSSNFRREEARRHPFPGMNCCDARTLTQ